MISLIVINLPRTHEKLNCKAAVSEILRYRHKTDILLLYYKDKYTLFSAVLVSLVAENGFFRYFLNFLAASIVAGE